MINWFAPWNLISRTKVRYKQPGFQEHTVEHISCPMTAREAFASACESLSLIDNFALKEIESIGDVNSDGSSFGWRFCLDLLSVQATSVVTWEVFQNSAHSGGLHIKQTIAPFPTIGSPVYQVVAQGMGSENLLNSAWEQMRAHSNDIPLDFIDSDKACQELFELGWIAPFKLSAQYIHDDCMWEAQHHGRSAYVQLCPNKTSVSVDG